jgi:hypothetical protein
MSGLSGLGNAFLADLRGTVMHCVQYGSGAKKKIVCRKFGKGAGQPSPGARRRAGVKGKFRERSHTMFKHRKPRSPGAKKRCIRKFKSGPKAGKCARFAPTGRPLKSARTAQQGRVCIRFFKKGKRKGKCAKFRQRGTMPTMRRKKSRKFSKRRPAASVTPKKRGKKRKKSVKFSKRKAAASSKPKKRRKSRKSSKRKSPAAKKSRKGKRKKSRKSSKRKMSSHEKTVAAARKSPGRVAGWW